MHLISIGIVAAVSTLVGFLSTANASDLATVTSTGTILVAGIDAPSAAASLAWAGENESFASLNLVESGFAASDDIDVNVQLITGIAAPEPPAIVLAGMAIGGALCGRSLFRKRRTATKKEVGA